MVCDTTFVYPHHLLAEQHTWLVLFVSYQMHPGHCIRLAAKLSVQHKMRATSETMLMCAFAYCTTVAVFGMMIIFAHVFMKEEVAAEYIHHLCPNTVLITPDRSLYLAVCGPAVDSKHA